MNGFTFVLPLVSAVLAPCALAQETTAQIPSTLDGKLQPALVLPAQGAEAAPLLVLLHWWSAHYDNFDTAGWKEEAAARGWHLLIPEFRGPNVTPEACASALARQDILDAVEWMQTHHPVDRQRVYLAGLSGGGHMAMVMAAHAPDLWAGVSAWAGISDLAQWHAETKAAGRDYWQHIEAVVGGAPGANTEIDQQLRNRSPLFSLREALHLPPMELATGINDGHTGSVPVHHTLDAFNAIAPKYQAAVVPQDVITKLSARDLQEGTGESVEGRKIYLRQEAGPSRVTIFEGGHEALPAAACAWLAEQRKQLR